MIIILCKLWLNKAVSVSVSVYLRKIFDNLKKIRQPCLFRQEILVHVVVCMYRYSVLVFVWSISLQTSIECMLPHLNKFNNGCLENLYSVRRWKLHIGLLEYTYSGCLIYLPRLTRSITSSSSIVSVILLESSPSHCLVSSHSSPTERRRSASPAVSHQLNL